MNPDSQNSPDGHKEPDSYQQAWQTHESQARVTIDTDLLLQEVQRNQQHFFMQILRRDIIEMGVGLLLLLYWLYQGVTSSLPWTWYLTVPAILWIVGFFLVDRIRHPQTLSEPGEPLLKCVKNSLTQVEHQIWLLRNIFWWYLLPPTLSILAFFAHVAWLSSEGWLDALSHAGNFVFLFALYYFIYWLNQRTVDSKLEPRRKELLTLLVSLGDESTSEHVKLSREMSDESSRKLKRLTIVTFSCLGALVVAAMASGIFDSSYDGKPRSSGPAGALLARLVTDLREEKNLVGLAAMVVVDGQVEAAAVQGQRKLGSGVSLEIGDRWHLGGITKSMSATMIARLVESGQMQWSDTVGEIFPEAAVHEEWKSVTLRQLLTDTAGSPKNFSIHVRQKWPALGLECTLARREAVLEVMADPPVHVPGKKFAYSNVSPTIAGALAEKATGETWEELMKREVFDPLELSEAGFGPPKSPEPTTTAPGLDQPQGHRTFLRGKVAVGDKADNTPIMGPGATVHMTLSNLCAFARDQMRGELGEGKLLSAETYKLLHTPELDDYAFGWAFLAKPNGIPHKLYWHNGSNTMWYALVVFIPEKNMVVAVTSNDGDFEQAEAAAWEIVKASANQFKDVRLARTSKASPSEDFPKKSPFAAVRWQEYEPEVKVGQQWFRLVSIDDLPAEEIVAFSRRTYGDAWRKRFEEDLVELLTRMGHSPQDKVTLVVQSLTSPETRTLADVPMTAANRRSIRAADQSRAIPEPQRERSDAVGSSSGG